MKLKYDEEKLGKAMQDFYNATGINLQLMYEDLSVFCHNPRVHNNFCRTIQCSDAGCAACRKSDLLLIEKCKNSRKAEMHICHAGLVDVCVPIIYGDEILGYIVLGQMKKETDFSAVLQNISYLPINPEEMKVYYENLPLFHSDRIDSVLNVAVMLAEHILFENMLQPKINRIVEQAAAFINDNLDKPLSVEYITKNTNVSKSALYKNFHDVFGCTVSEYINSRRVERAVRLLRDTALSIEEISQNVGFSSAAYFTAKFKRQMGIPPLKFRKASQYA